MQRITPTFRCGREVPVASSTARTMSRAWRANTSSVALGYQANRSARSGVRSSQDSVSLKMGWNLACPFPAATPFYMSSMTSMGMASAMKA